MTTTSAADDPTNQPAHPRSEIHHAGGITHSTASAEAGGGDASPEASSRRATFQTRVGEDILEETGPVVDVETRADDVILCDRHETNRHVESVLVNLMWTAAGLATV